MTRLKPLPLLLLAFVAFYLLPLGLHGLWIPDETRYGQISQEMLQSGNWVAPHFMGIRYFEKPAGGYWLIALGQAVFGQNLFGVRIASALTSGLSVLLAYLIARRLWNDPRKSFACALLYLSFGLVAGQAGYSNLDPQFTLWVNLSLVALWFALDSHTVRDRLWAWAVVGLACALGFLTKGFLALALPVLIAVPYMLWQRRLGELLRYGPLAMLVCLLVCLPWALAIHLQEPDFWRFFFWNEHIRRFSADNAQHVRPWWFFLPIIAVACLPWAGLLPNTLRKTWQERRQPAIAFLALWLLLPLGFFSLSNGKLPTYIMPCLLPLALLMGHTLVGLINQHKARSICLNGLLNFVIGMAAMIVLIYLQIARPLYSNSHAEMFSLSLAFIVLLGWILTNLLQAFRPLTLWAMPALGIGLLVILLPASMPEWIADNEMPDQFVLEHLEELQQTQALLSNELGNASALAWRLKRPEVALYDTEGELRYGLQYAGSVHRKVELEEVQDWLKEQRQLGSVGVLMRVNSTSEMREAGQLPPGGKRYYKGSLELIIYPQSP
ncbi:lipid IV(A) 4-amino-4-deoxy-L-arabinosyltransferase [Pseudomonas reactans]|uniref:Undecaprenyl phosphate-alpha-4-amino-4-deoxy-L-arabinose arabinosyl transferase n=1 Tax=Pseudomonas reactans TaxID=117680 RepID=A0ABX2R568_9PSED|nr:lipid IV(A) 4-amino-4-deoxy-L-arabinosyltransferase [Pseudomonas reactans]NWA42105.1 lipid IV(A) 4-amino-4-deoxy-L-arabinosyltransferase [Pseudomonas reactans]NWC86551.1 lipid IV(A) 4-amino-4-deoxy-L-arabinosyltransferase [Pseudomonas reactans]NWD30875.1 lipid IV(A) 4-amino-4-deoxy-L-arabinosyltransferase [Pseudomonas reactans]NWD99143.1 lipid IV(A) 4-amino-4-deoxy-L-arabinosyltransferase [Pseudomonas reactans]